MCETKANKFIYWHLTHREAIISPGGPLHLAVLDVEGEILNRDITGGLEHAVAQPNNLGVGGEGGGVSLNILCEIAMRLQQCFK